MSNGTRILHACNSGDWDGRGPVGSTTPRRGVLILTNADAYGPKTDWIVQKKKQQLLLLHQTEWGLMQRIERKQM